MSRRRAGLASSIILIGAVLLLVGYALLVPQHAERLETRATVVTIPKLSLM